jgi:hypothetical protein
LFIRTLDPDLIRTRIGIQPKMLDSDLDKMNTDSKHCRKKGVEQWAFNGLLLTTSNLNLWRVEGLDEKH